MKPENVIFAIIFIFVAMIAALIIYGLINQRLQPYVQIIAILREGVVLPYSAVNYADGRTVTAYGRAMTASPIFTSDNEQLIARSIEGKYTRSYLSPGGLAQDMSQGINILGRRKGWGDEELNAGVRTTIKPYHNFSIVPFYIEDDTGARIEVSDAEPVRDLLSPSKPFMSITDPVFAAMGSAGSDTKYEGLEYNIPFGAPVYIVGALRNESGKLILEPAPDIPYVISSYQAGELIDKLETKTWLAKVYIYSISGIGLIIFIGWLLTILTH